MDIKEIESEIYTNLMRINSIEAMVERVPPFSDEFSSLVAESLRLQERQKQLGQMRLQERQKQLRLMEALFQKEQ